MGYYTRYSLSQVKNPDYTGVVEEYIKQHDLPVDENSDACKWYNHDSEMKSMSLVFPNIVFRLHGEGEETGDIWEKYFYNGVIIHEERLRLELPVPDLSKY